MDRKPIDWKAVWDRMEHDWSDGREPDFDDELAAAFPMIAADGYTAGQRGIPPWVFTYIMNSQRFWPKDARDVDEALRGLAIVRSNLIALDEEFRRRTNSGGSYHADYRPAFEYMSYHAQDFGIDEPSPVRAGRAISRACIIRYIDAVGTKLRQLGAHADEPLPPQPPAAMAADPATPTIRWAANQRKGTAASVTISYPRLGSGVQTLHVVHGSTQARLLTTLLEHPGRVVNWMELVQSGVRSGAWLVTSPKSLERAGRRIRNALPPELRGYWEQDGLGMRWSLEDTVREDGPAPTSPGAAA